MMDRAWERKKAIVNGQHMRATRYQMDTEYQAYLRQQEREREQAECARAKRAAERHSSYPARTLYSDRTYSKPWQTGMNAKTQILGRSENVRKNPELQCVPLPSISKEKQPMRKKVPLRNTAHPAQQSITISQPRFTVEKKRVHERQHSSKPNVAHGRDATLREGHRLKGPEKKKEPRRKVQQQKLKFEEQEKTIRPQNNAQLPCSEQLRGESPTVSDAASFGVSTFQTSGDPETTEDGESSEESGINEDINGDVSYSLNANRVPLRPPSSTEPDFFRNMEFDTGNIFESDEEEELQYMTALNHDINTESLEPQLHRVETARSFPSRSPSSLPTLTSPRSMPEDRQANPPLIGHSTNSRPDSFLNLRDMIELRRMGVALAPLNSTPVVPETTLPRIYDIHANNRDVQNPVSHSDPQPYLRRADGVDRTLPGDGASSIPHGAPQGLPSLHDNFDLIFQTISMQRQSERRNSEVRVHSSLDKENLKPKADPEKLKRMQESLLEEDSEEEEGDLCRICLTAGETSKNQLTVPCKCTGSLKYVHTECLKKWLLSKIQSGAELSAVRTCEMCKQNLECDFEGFSLNDHYRRHQESQAALNPRLYLVLLLHLYQQRYEELLRLSNTRESVNEVSRQFSHLALSEQDSNSREDNRES